MTTRYIARYKYYKRPIIFAYFTVDCRARQPDKNVLLLMYVTEARSIVVKT